MKRFAEENGEHEADYISKKMNISVWTPLYEIDMTELVIHQAWFEGRVVLTRAYINKIMDKFNLRPRK